MQKADLGHAPSVSISYVTDGAQAGLPHSVGTVVYDGDNSCIEEL